MVRYYDRWGCRGSFLQGEGGRMIKLRLDRVVDCLEDYLAIAAASRAPGERERDAVEAIRELRKVIAYRGNVLFVLERVKRSREYFLAVGREKTAEPPRIEG